MEPFAAVVLSEGQATHTAGVPSIRYVPMAHCTHTPLEDSSYPGLQSSEEFNSKCAISRLAAYIQHQHKVDLLKKRIFHTEILPLFHKKKNHIQINQYYKKSQPNAVYCTGGNFCFERKCLVGIYWGNINNDDNSEQ